MKGQKMKKSEDIAKENARKYLDALKVYKETLGREETYEERKKRMNEYRCGKMF